MVRRKLFWQIGSADAARAVVGANLAAHGDALSAAGLRVVASGEEARLATHELLRTHRAAGLTRSEVEGRWYRICQRVWDHKGVSLLSTPDLSGADKDQIRLALDPLIGLEVHLVFTLDSFSEQIYGGWLASLRAGGTTDWQKYAARVLAASPEHARVDHAQAERFWASHDLVAVLARWGWTFRAERLHVVASGDPREHWVQFLDIAGWRVQDGQAPGGSGGSGGSGGLQPVLPAYADPAGVAVLRMVNRHLEAPLGRSATGLLTDADPEGAAMPVVPTGSLSPLMADWAEKLTAAGHDLRGDLGALVSDGNGDGIVVGGSLPGPRDQLVAAVEALADAMAENSALRVSLAQLVADRDRLDRKRRKLKRRLRKERAGGRSAS